MKSEVIFLYNFVNNLKKKYFYNADFLDIIISRFLNYNIIISDEPR